MGGSRRGLGLAGTKPCWQMGVDSVAAREETSVAMRHKPMGAFSSATEESTDADHGVENADTTDVQGGASEPSTGAMDVLRRWGWLLVSGHLMAWLPFAWVTRVAFLYHYIPALLLSVLATALVFDALTTRLAHVRVPLGGRAAPSLKAVLAAAVLVSVALSSLYFAPLVFGWPLTPADSQRRTRLLDTWGSPN